MRFGLLVASLIMVAACAGGGPALAQPRLGMTEAELIGAMGQPQAQQIFSMPAPPFFGPQEALTGVVEPGTKVTEWQYERDEQVLYVWFVATAEGNRVVGFFKAPAGAVY